MTESDLIFPQSIKTSADSVRAFSHVWEEMQCSEPGPDTLPENLMHYNFMKVVKVIRLLDGPWPWKSEHGYHYR